MEETTNTRFSNQRGSDTFARDQLPSNMNTGQDFRRQSSQGSQMMLEHHAGGAASTAAGKPPTNRTGRTDMPTTGRIG